VKRVLIIASDYPPKLSMASRRPFCLSKYLPEYGWEAVVLTITEKHRTINDHSGTHVIESDLLKKPAFIEVMLDIVHGRKRTTKSKIVGNDIEGSPLISASEPKGITMLRNILFYPDRFFISWYYNAIKTYRQVAKDIHIDAIISTAKPFTTHLIARHIKNKIHVPWVADFRDPWPHWKLYVDYTKYSPNYFINMMFFKWTLMKANILIAVTKPSAQLLRKRFKEKIVYNIPNGYDPDDYSQEINSKPNIFLLTYTGHVREDRLDPEILLSCISQLILNKHIDSKKIKIRFYGEVTDKLLRDIERYRIKELVEAKGYRINRNELIVKQKESSVLIVFAALDQGEVGTMPGKVYEYLAAERPILAIGKPAGRDVLENIIKTTQAGVYARTKEECKKTILFYYNQYVKTGKVRYSGIKSEIDKFSYKEIALKYAEALNKITDI